MHVVIEEQALQLHQDSLHAVRGTPTLMPPGVVWAQGGRFELEEVCAKDILPASWAAALPIAGPCQRGVLEEVSEDVGVRQEVVELYFRGLPRVVLGQEEHHVDAEPTEVARDGAHGDMPLVDVVFHYPHINAGDPTATQVIEVFEEAVLHKDLLAVVQLGHLRAQARLLCDSL